METCEHEGCDAARGKRSPWCDEHKAARLREWNKLRMRRKRQQDAADKILGVTGISGRSIPGQSADAYTPTTSQHPSRLWARREEPEVISYLEPGSTQRPGVHGQSAPRTDLQRYSAPHVDEDAWAHDSDAGYYDRVDFRARNDMAQGPYRGGYIPAGNPVAFEVRRVSR
jgi:hypothetical protein